MLGKDTRYDTGDLMPSYTPLKKEKKMDKPSGASVKETGAELAEEKRYQEAKKRHEIIDDYRTTIDK
ncbi:hypothetical protein CUJ83_07090 [Methanocella sp. CWC-04]|uniref:Uncharacterized protein n=2 Tax=Methanooceanicella nereidis TaxID=2052831 RepID=A0AAP2W613_9EURY|nr:hypothetical protein [Methanocella sp. CWC-04]